MPSEHRQYQTRCAYISIAVGSILAFVIGILIGRFATCPDEKTEGKQGLYLQGVSEALVEDGDTSIGEEIMNNIRTENIRENLRYALLYFITVNRSSYLYTPMRFQKLKMNALWQPHGHLI